MPWHQEELVLLFFQWIYRGRKQHVCVSSTDFATQFSKKTIVSMQSCTTQTWGAKGCLYIRIRDRAVLDTVGNALYCVFQRSLQHSVPKPLFVERIYYPSARDKQRFVLWVQRMLQSSETTCMRFSTDFVTQFQK